MKSDKLKLILLLVMAALPITAATILFQLSERQGVGATSNKGRLIIPVLDITELDMRSATGDTLFRTFEEEVAGISPQDYRPRPWMLVYLGGAACDATCEERLYYLRQLHRRLATEAPRVKRYYLAATLEPMQDSSLDAATAELFATSFPDMEIAYGDPQAIRAALARTVEEDADPIAEHYIYVVDPVGNVMLYFTPENTPEDILEDVDKLLERSSLG